MAFVNDARLLALAMVKDYTYRKKKLWLSVSRSLWWHIVMTDSMFLSPHSRRRNWSALLRSAMRRLKALNQNSKK